MIYQVNGYNKQPTYFVDQKTYDENNGFKQGTLIVGQKSDAELLLSQNQQQALTYEAGRFSICATFINGTDTTWREIQETDPENIVCQVLNAMTGTYTQVDNKTEAYTLNEQRKQEFLFDIQLDKVIELIELPKPLKQPVTQGTQTL